METVRKIGLTLIGLAAAIAAFYYSTDVIQLKQQATNPVSHAVNDSNFQYAMKTIIRHEGGLENNPSDKGAWTNYGISLRYLQNEHFDLNGDGVISKDDIIQLTRSKADEIYYKQWYIKNRYDLISDKIIMTDIMDFSINVGASQCHKTIKRAINRIISEAVPIDGHLDDQTIEIINLLEPTSLHETFNDEQEKFYRGLVKKHPALSVFLKGWISRSKD